MAKISNTTVYPNIVPAPDDYLVLTDASDSNRTRTVTVGELQSSIVGGTITVSVDVSHSEFKNTWSQPVVLITGTAGKHIQPISIIAKYTFGGNAYTTPNDFVFGLGSVVNPFLYSGIPASYINSVLTDVAFALPTSSVTSFGNSYTTSAGGDNLIFACETANPIAGNGTITFDIMYRLVTA